MRIVRLPWHRRDGGPTTVAEPAEPQLPSLEQLRSEIEELSEANRADPDPNRERAILRARHLAGIRLIDEALAAPRFANAGGVVLPEGDPLPEFRREDLTPELLRAAILRDGCALVRHLIPRQLALDLADGIDTAYARREAGETGEGPDDAYYDEFVPHDRFSGPMLRPWIKEGGGLLAADSPRLSFRMHELFAQAELPPLVADYLGEPALISAHKTTLRKAEPSVSGAWHQDGSFMGPVRSLNLWVSLSRCGDEAPGLDIMPRRLSEYVATGTAGAELNWTISEQVVQDAAAGSTVTRPIFEPGDALLFDELFLHKTGSDPSMPNPRFAIENWFFGASAFPAEYAPIAV
jgi:hypothetical protein